MAVPIVQIPGDRMSHSLGVPIEFMSMEADVAGLAEAATYGGSASSVPPEMMLHQAVDSGNLSPEGYLPPEFGMKRIRRVESRQPLLPGQKEADSSPDTQEIKEIEKPMPRTEMTDVYPAIDDGGEGDVMGDPVFLTGDRLSASAGGSNGIYSTFVSGGLSDSPAGPSPAAAPPVLRSTPKSGLVNWAMNNKVQAVATVTAAFLFYKYVIKPNMGR